MTSRQALLTAVGSTQASSVMAVVRRSEAASATVTSELAPLKSSAWPYRPVDAQVVPAAVPVLPLPDASTTVVPDTSSNAIRRDGGRCRAAGRGRGGGVRVRAEVRNRVCGTNAVAVARCRARRSCRCTSCPSRSSSRSARSSSNRLPGSARSSSRSRATLSVAAPQLRSIRPLLIADAVNVPGADGGPCQTPLGVTAVDVFEYAPRFGTASAARTR